MRFTKEEAIKMVFNELALAEQKHGNWPEDYIHAAAIVVEEAGELVKDSIDHVLGGKDRTHEMTVEAAQVAAMGIRFLLNMADNQPTT